MEQIDAQSFDTRLANGEDLNILDVREEIEYHTYNIGGENVPLTKINEKLSQMSYNKNDEIIVICRAGIRSQTAQALLLQKGYTNVKNLTGGLLALQRLQQ